jgi:hypothetical protein
MNLHEENRFLQKMRDNNILKIFVSSQNINIRQSKFLVA